MGLDEFYEEIKRYPFDDYIVYIRLKHDFEEEYRYTNELYIPEYFDYVWLHDWWEGEDDVTILGFTAVADVDVPSICRQK